MNLTFKIPEHGSLIPKKGSKISIGDKFIAIQSSEYKSYSVTSGLSVKPETIFNYVAIVVGQPVEPGMILAEKKSLVGKKQLTSDISGVVDKIEYEMGEIIVRFGSDKASQAVSAFFNGALEEIDEKKASYTISLPGGHSFALKTAKGNSGGEMYVLDDKDFFSVSADEVAGKLVILENPQVHILSKLEALDAMGCLSINDFPSTTLPHGVLAQKKDLDTIISSKKPYLVFSELELSAVVYS